MAELAHFQRRAQFNSVTLSLWHHLRPKQEKHLLVGAMAPTLMVVAALTQWVAPQ
jgi:hypothetical protein